MAAVRSARMSYTHIALTVDRSGARTWRHTLASELPEEASGLRVILKNFTHIGGADTILSVHWSIHVD